MRPIDADALYKVIEEVYNEPDHSLADAAWWFLGKLEDAPTILPLPNEPLTLKALREMKLFEWIWIELIRPSRRQVFREIKSAYYQAFEDYTDGKSLCCGWPGLIYEFEYEDYGKAWIAYRHMPEEGF